MEWVGSSCRLIGSYISDQYSVADWTDDDDSSSEYSDDEEDSGSKHSRLLFKPSRAPKNKIEKHEQLLEYLEEGNDAYTESGGNVTTKVKFRKNIKISPG